MTKTITKEKIIQAFKQGKIGYRVKRFIQVWSMLETQIICESELFKNASGKNPLEKWNNMILDLETEVKK